MNFEKNELRMDKRPILVYFREQAWVESVFSNMACNYGVIIEVNPKFCKCGIGELCQNIS